MRLVVDTLIALALVATLAGIGWHRHSKSVQLRHVEAVQAALRSMQSQVLYHAGLRDVPLTDTGYPQTLQPDWFDDPPRNAWNGGEAPWLDTASVGERRQWDPQYLAIESGRAAFWYNPYRGIVRARVPRQLSDRATCDLYNLVNGTAVEPDEVIW